MPENIRPSEIPVLLLFSLDPGWSPQEQDEVGEASELLGKAISSVGHPTTLVSVSHSDIRSILASYNPLENVVLNWCEELPGINNSEWLVARDLELSDFTFTGADSTALALAHNKHHIKQLMERSGIPTPLWKVFDKTPTPEWRRFPAIVKPINAHCSEGIDSSSVVTTEEELESRVRFILDTFNQPALVEDFIDGRELHVSLWGNGRIEVLPPAEMDFSSFGDARDRICSYEAKFMPDSVQYQNIRTVLPAALNQDELRRVGQVCRAAYHVSGCRDYARIDLRIKDGVLYVLDINPNSDISADTSTVSAAEHAGYSYGEFGSWLVRLAARRHPVWGEEQNLVLPK